MLLASANGAGRCIAAAITPSSVRVEPSSKPRAVITGCERGGVIANQARRRRGRAGTIALAAAGLLLSSCRLTQSAGQSSTARGPESGPSINRNATVQRGAAVPNPATALVNRCFHCEHRLTGDDLAAEVRRTYLDGLVELGPAQAPRRWWPRPRAAPGVSSTTATFPTLPPCQTF